MIALTITKQQIITMLRTISDTCNGIEWRPKHGDVAWKINYKCGNKVNGGVVVKGELTCYLNKQKMYVVLGKIKAGSFKCACLSLLNITTKVK